MTKQQLQVRNICLKIKELATSGMNMNEIEKVVQDLSLPLGAHLAIMGDLTFIMKNGRLETEQDKKIKKLSN